MAFFSDVYPYSVLTEGDGAPWSGRGVGGKKVLQQNRKRWAYFGRPTADGNNSAERVHSSHRRLLGITVTVVSSLGWVTPRAATEGVTPLFFS